MQHRPWSPANDHSPLAADTAAQPTLVCRHSRLAVLRTAYSRAGVDTVSSYGEEGRSDSTALSMDLLVHLRQNFRCLARDRCFAGHQAWTETDLMFAPYPRARRGHRMSSGLAGRPRTSAGCTLGTIQSVPTVAGRTRSLASRMRRSSTACSLVQVCIAQQMLDLQMNLQTDARCTARKVSANLAASIRPVYHPLTWDGRRADGMQGSRLARRRDCSG